MKILFYSAKDFEIPYLSVANTQMHEISLVAEPLSLEASEQAAGFDVVSIFTADDASAPVIEKLFHRGVRHIAIRAAGYDNVDLAKAKQLGIKVANVPAYSPYAIAEHAITMILALNRKLVTADRQVHQHDFTLGKLVGFDLHGKTVGVIGTGRTGAILIKILHGFGCRILGFDITETPELVKEYGLEYVSLNTLCQRSDIISLHTSLNPRTKYLINKELIGQMKPGVMLINTSRGGCVNTRDLLHFLDNGHIGYFGADVYESERGVFFFDLSNKGMHDEILARLLSYPNVLVTPHQAFATHEALTNISDTTFYNIDCWRSARESENELTVN